MKNPGFILLLLVTIVNSIHAQQPVCGTDQLQLNFRALSSENYYREFSGNELIREKSLPGNYSAGGTLIIPVVFHILHNNGPENVPDSIIIAAVEELNLRYQNAAPYFDSTGHVVNIQFCLATIDPQGNPTTGITRTVTPFTNVVFPVDDQAVKNQVRWSPELYYNVWVVNHITGFIDGYAAFPFYAGQSIDGVVIEYLYITNSYLLAHETGHYCGLYHTFEGGCTNFNCMLNGDQVCDTPPDNTFTGFPCMPNSCNTELQDTTGMNPFTSDVNELPNYMDYATCPNSFSQGQVTRMEVSVSTLRSNLLISNGCGANPGQPAPTAGFTFAVDSCQNGKVTFSDSNSINSVTSEWDFDNDGIYDTLAHNFIYTFPATGNYTVWQRVTGIGGMDSTSQTLSVLKGSTFNYPLINYTQSITDTILVCEGNTVTFEADSNGVSWMWSTGDSTWQISFIADSSFDISLVMTDTNGFTWDTECTPIHVQVFPFNTPAITFDDTVGYQCQGDIVTLYINNPIPGTYTWMVYYNGLGWVNTGDHSLSYEHIPDPTYGNQYYVNYTNPAGCTAQSNYVLIQPQYLAFLNNVPLTVNGYTLSYPTSNFQYQWYNWGVPVPGATSPQYTVTSTGCYNLVAWPAAYPLCESYTDTVCFLFSGIEENAGYELQLSPNPATNHILINSPLLLAESGTVTIYSTTGTVLIRVPGVKQETGEKSYQLDLMGLSNGIYIIEISTATGISRSKFIVQD